MDLASAASDTLAEKKRRERSATLEQQQAEAKAAREANDAAALARDEARAAAEALALSEGKPLPVETEEEKELPAEVEPFLISMKDVYDRLVEQMPLEMGKGLSRHERVREELVSTSLAYGEATFEAFTRTMQKIKHRFGGFGESGQGVFVDLGSGTGKVVLLAALMHDFKVVRGLEILQNLHEAANDKLKLRWEKQIKPTLELRIKMVTVDLKRADMLSYQWEDGDDTQAATVLYSMSTCFNQELLEALARKADKCRVGTLWITMSQTIPSKKWKVLDEEDLPMSFGDVTVFILRKEV